MGQDAGEFGMNRGEGHAVASSQEELKRRP